MVVHRIGKIDRVVAHHTVLACRDVIVEFAERDPVVMAGLTVVQNARVIVHPGCEGTRRMAGTTVIRGRHVIRMHARRRYTMTGGAVVDDAGVIEHAPGETVRVVAGAAVRVRRRV